MTTRTTTTAHAMTTTTIMLIALMVLLFLPSPSHAQSTVTLVGKLIDRQCSVEDVYQVQPLTERRCTLWFQVQVTTTTTATFTVYCPNAAVDGRPLNGAYWTCSDPGALQIKHPTRTYVISGYLRTQQQQADGYGQVGGTGFQY